MGAAVDAQARHSRVAVGRGRRAPLEGVCAAWAPLKRVVAALGLGERQRDAARVAEPALARYYSLRTVTLG